MDAGHWERNRHLPTASRTSQQVAWRSLVLSEAYGTMSFFSPITVHPFNQSPRRTPALCLSGAPFDSLCCQWREELSDCFDGPLQKGANAHNTYVSHFDCISIQSTTQPTMNLTHTSSAPATECMKEFLHSMHYNQRVSPHCQSGIDLPVGEHRFPMSHGVFGRLTVIDNGTWTGTQGF